MGVNSKPQKGLGMWEGFKIEEEFRVWEVEKIGLESKFYQVSNELLIYRR